LADPGIHGHAVADAMQIMLPALKQGLQKRGNAGHCSQQSRLEEDLLRLT